MAQGHPIHRIKYSLLYSDFLSMSFSAHCFFMILSLHEDFMHAIHVVCESQETKSIHLCRDVYVTGESTSGTCQSSVSTLDIIHINIVYLNFPEVYFTLL